MLTLNKKTKSTIKRLAHTTYPTRYVAHSILWRLRYKKIDKRLFKKELSSEIIRNYQEKWSVFGYPVESKTLTLCYSLSGVINLNIIPGELFSAVVEPTLNKYKEKELSFLATKNIYEKWFNNSEVFPKSYFHKVDNLYYDSELKLINDIDSFLEQAVFNYPIICKPSLGTAGGEGIQIIKSLDELKGCISSYEHLVFQEKLQQNSYLNSINPNINSIRVCLYRDLNGCFNVINASIRFGVNGGLDNTSAGGLACSIGKEGQLNDYALTINCEKHFKHPNSNIYFSDIVIPKYNELLDISKAIAMQIPLCNLVSLDMCLDQNDSWRCLEINLDNQTIDFPQFAGKGFFGEYTDEIIDRVLRSL